MSFGWSATDVANLAKLIWTTVRNCRKACGEYDEVTRQCESLHSVIRRLKREKSNPTSLLNRREDFFWQDLLPSLDGIQKVVLDIDSIVAKYASLNRKEKGLGRLVQLWTKAKFGNKELDALNDLRSRARFFTSTMSTLLETVTSGSLGRIERSLDEAGLKDLKPAIEGIARKMVASNRKEGSVLTAYTNDDSTVWRDLRRELVKEKLVPSDIISQHRGLIHDFIRELGERGTLDVSPSEAETKISFRGKSDILPREIPSQSQESLAISAPGRTSFGAQSKDETRFHQRDLADESDISCGQSRSHGSRFADTSEVRAGEHPSRSSRRRRTKTRRKRQSTMNSVALESTLDYPLFSSTSSNDRSEWKGLDRQAKLLRKGLDRGLGKQHGLDEAIIPGVRNPTSHEALLNLGFGHRIPDLIANIPLAERAPGSSSSMKPKFQFSEYVLLHMKESIVFLSTPWGICLMADGFNVSFLLEYFKYVMKLAEAMQKIKSSPRPFTHCFRRTFKLIDFIDRKIFEWDSATSEFAPEGNPEGEEDQSDDELTGKELEEDLYGLDSRGNSWFSNLLLQKVYDDCNSTGQKQRPIYLLGLAAHGGPASNLS